MAGTIPDFRNILVIDFGQLGDVILSLPALGAIRERFPEAKITLLIGKPGADIVRIAGISDAQILVDRVELRDGNKFKSISKIFKLMRQIRSLKFDLVIDLHSLSETNILGFISGAKYRLYANRENRSHDRLARFPTYPPKEDKSKHYTDRYFDALKPLEIGEYQHDFRLAPPAVNIIEIEQLFVELGVNGKQLVGLFVGAGHPSRCWSLDNFAALAMRLLDDPTRAVLVFLGPEEIHLLDKIHDIFPPSAIILDKLKLLPLMAASSKLDVLVTNDTGPMHLAAIAGSPIVLVSDRRAPDCFLPLTQNLSVLNDGTIDEITVDQVADATLQMLAKPRL